MDYVVLDTDVASLIFRDRLPASAAARLAGKTWCLTFVTVGEMTQWAALRDWSRRNQAALEAWMARCIMVNASWETAQTWGRMAASGKRRGRTHPINDAWIAACCLTEGLPLAILTAWQARRDEQVRAEAEAIANDPDDVAEARAVLSDMESLRSW